jgi:antitoxin HicB
MKANPRDWRIETLKSVADAHGRDLSPARWKPRDIPSPEWCDAECASAPADQSDLRQEVCPAHRRRCGYMRKLKIEYPFEVRPLSWDDGGGYSVTFHDLPGCGSDGATPEEAVANGRDALESWLAVAREFGDKTPGPFSSASGRFVQCLPRSLHAHLIAKAKAEGVSLNTLVVSLISEGLGRRQTGRVSARRLAVRSSNRTTKAARRSAEF